MEGLASRYASALLKIAAEQNALRDFKALIVALDASFETNPDIIEYLTSAFVPIEEKEAMVDKIVPSSFPDIANFLKLLCLKRRIHHFHPIKKEYVRMTNAALEIKEGTLFSRLPISDAQLEAIATTLGASLGCEVELHNEIDTSVLGGFKIIIQGRIYDHTLNEKLSKLRTKMLERGDLSAH